MPRGQPDYGAQATHATTGSLADMAELAVRLGSIVTFDRRGEVINFDDFEQPTLGWNGHAIPPGGSSYFSSTTFKTGSQSYYLTPLAAAGAERNIDKGFQISGTKKIGVEISFNTIGSLGSLVLRLWYYDGSTVYKAEVKVDANTKKLYLYNTAAGWTEIGDTGIITTSAFHFQTIKFVADFNINKYARLLFMQQEIDLSAHDIYSFGSGLIPSFLVSIAVVSLGIAGSATWVDNFVLTQAEP